MGLREAPLFFANNNTHILFLRNVRVSERMFEEETSEGSLGMEVTQVGAAFNITMLQRIQAVKTKLYTSY